MILKNNYQTITVPYADCMEFTHRINDFARYRFLALHFFGIFAAGLCVARFINIRGMQLTRELRIMRFVCPQKIVQKRS